MPDETPPQSTRPQPVCQRDVQSDTVKLNLRVETQSRRPLARHADVHVARFAVHEPETRPVIASCSGRSSAFPKRTSVPPRMTSTSSPLTLRASRPGRRRAGRRPAHDRGQPPARAPPRPSAARPPRNGRVCDPDPRQRPGGGVVGSAVRSLARSRARPPSRVSARRRDALRRRRSSPCAERRGRTSRLTSGSPSQASVRGRIER